MPDGDQMCQGNDDFDKGEDVENNFGVWVPLKETTEATIKCSRQHREGFRNGGGKNQFCVPIFLVVYHIIFMFISICIHMPIW